MYLIWHKYDDDNQTKYFIKLHKQNKCYCKISTGKNFKHRGLHLHLTKLSQSKNIRI